jgi:hypothetical protein
VDAFFGTLRDTLSGKDRLYVGAASSAEVATLLVEAGPTETAFSIASTSARARSSKRASRSPSPSKRKSKSVAAKAFAAGYELPKLSSLNPLPKFQVCPTPPIPLGLASAAPTAVQHSRIIIVGCLPE